MTDKIDITIRTKEYEQKMENLNAQIKNLNTEIANLKSRAHDQGLGLYHNEETVARYTQKKQKEIDELNTQLQKLEQKYAEEQTILISGKISEIKDKIELLKKYQETAKKNPSLAEEYSEELFFKKSAEMQKEVAKKEAFLKNLEKQRDDERKKNADIEQRLKEERKAIFAKRKQGFSEPASQGYKGYTFEKLSDQELNQIQEAVKAGTIKGLEDLKRMIPTGKTVPLEYMKLFEGKRPSGERAHDYQETGKTAELYKDIFKGIKTISITEGGKTLFGDDYATKEQLIAYKQEADQKIKEIEDKRDKADQKQIIILNNELDELRKKANSLQAKIRDYDKGYPAKRGTVFHSFAEMMALGKLPKLKEALYSGDTKLSKILIDKYFKKGITAETLIGDSTTGFTKEDTEILNEFLDKIKDFTDVGGTSYGFFQGLNNYVNFLKENNITLTDAVEKSIGFVTNINGELVKFVGTIDAIFGNLLLDLKTGKMHPSAIAWQVNMGNFMRQMITGESAQKLGAFNPGMGKDFIPGFIPVDLIPREIMSQLIFEAGTGKKTDIDLTKYVKGGVFTDVTTDEETGETYPITYINQRKLPKGDYGASPKLKSEIDTLERESNELVESIKTLKGDELEHVLNQIYFTTDYSKGGIEGNKFYRQGYFWDLVRKKLPYDISTVLNYAMSEDGAAPKSKGVGTKTYRIEQGEGESLAEIDVPTVLGISLKQWAKLANILSELPDGAKKVEKLVALFEKEFESFSPDEQKRVVSSFNTLMTSESNFNPEYIRLKNQRELLRAKLQRPEQFENVNVDETQTALTAIDEQIAELERGNGLNFYQKFETFWNDVASEASKQLVETITESMSGFRSVKEFTEDKEQRQREYNPDVFDLETDEDGYRYVSRSGVQKDPIKMATITANRIGRIIDYSTRLEKAIEPMAKEMGVPVSDLAKTLLTDFAEKTGDRDAFNRYIRSKEFASDFKTAFPNFKGQITSEVEKWLVERLDPTIKEEAEVLSGIEEAQAAGLTTRYKLDKSGNLVDKKVTAPHNLLKSVLGRRLSGTLYSDKEIIPLEVIDDLLQGKNLGITERREADLPPSSDHSIQAVNKRQKQLKEMNEEAIEREEEWAKEFLNYDELMPKAEQVLKGYLEAETNLQSGLKEFKDLEGQLDKYGGIKGPSKDEFGFETRFSDWQEIKEEYDASKSKLKNLKSKMTRAKHQVEKTFKSGKVAGYSSEKMSDFLKKRAEEGIEKKRKENIAYAAAYSYKFSGKDKKELTEDDINEYLKFYSEQFEMSTEELLKEYNKENVYMGFYDFLQKKAKEKNITLRRFSPAKTKTAVEKGIGEGVADKITETIGDATDKINGQTIEQAVSEVVSDAVDIGGVDEKAVNEAVVEKTQAKVKAKSQKTRKPRKKSTTHVATDGAAISNEVPLPVVTPPQQDNSAILSELQGIHKDSQSIDSKMDYVLPSKDSGASNKMEVSSDGGTGGGDGGGKKPPKSGGRKGKSDEEKAQADTEKRQKQDIREYQQYINKVISLESQIDKLQRQATLSGGKHKDAIYGTIDALNEELGDLNRNNDALKQRVATEQAATKESIDATAALKKQSNAQKNLVSVKGATSIWDMMANDIRRATMRIADFGVAAKILNKIPQDIQKVIQYTKELDAAMTNIRIVSGKSMEEAQEFMRGLQQIAQETGTTLSELASAANEWLRQGYESTEEIEELLDASTKLSKLGMIPASESVKLLTSSLKGMKLSANEAISVVDKLTKLDMKSATSAQELAQALSKVANSARLAKVSQDEILGILSVGIETTQQSGDVIGTAVRSLLARFSNVKASKFSGSGEETEGTLNDTEAVLSKIGIRIRNASGEMRSFMDVLDDVAEKWDTLDDVSRNAISTAMAGTRQKEIFASIIENYDRVKELIGESANAAGTADEKYTAYMDSMEAATKRLQNAWEGFTQSLETSTVMKFLTNKTALLVENADKLKYLVTYIAAAGSAKIFDFFTNKGETGGFKGLIANIPFIGRGTKTNNILESIDKKVGNIEKGVGADSLANQTKNGGLFKRIGSFLKNGFGFGDIYDPNSDTSISRKTLKLYKQSQKGKIRLGDDFLGYTKGLTDDERELLRLSATVGQEDAKKMMETYNKLLKQRKRQNAAMGAASAVLTNLFTTKQVGGDIGGFLMKNIMGMGDNEQAVEETTGDKIRRTLFSGGLAAAGGALLGPLGAMLGQTLGEGFASMFATWYHRDELAMKQRVAEAKENLSALGDIKNAIENNEDLLSKDSYTSEDYEKLKTYTDSLRKTFTNNDNLTKSFLDDVNDLDIGTFTTIEDILSQITKGNADINKQLKKQLELTTARLTVEETLGEQKDDRTKIESQIGKDIKEEVSSGMETRRVANLETTMRRGGNVRDLIYDTYISPKNIGLYEQLKKEGLIDFSTNKYQLTAASGSTTYSEYIKSLSIAGNSIVEQLDNAKKVLEKVRSTEGGDLAQKWEKVVDEYQKQVNKQTELNNELLSTQVDYAYLTSDILNTKSRDEIRDLGMEGVVKIIRDELISQGVGVVDEQGVIHQDAYDAIVKKIRSDSTLSDYISKDIRSIGELISKNDVQGIEAFARAFGLTTEAAKELGKQFGYLTQSMGLMNVQETTEYYDKLGTVFSNLSSNVALTAEQINSLLTTSELKDLLPYLMNQDDPDALIKELYKRIYGGGQDVHMENALYDATMGMSTDKFREYLQNKGLKKYADEIDKGGYTTLSQIRDVVKEFDETDPRRQAFLEYLETINYTYSKDLTALEKPSEYIKSQLEEQINNLQEQKDALSQINDEREKELNLIKAKQALEDARKEKRRVYRQGIGFSYESNEEAIAEAQKNLENLNTQKRQENLQTQIDALQMQKNIIEALPNQAQLEQTKKIWELWAADKGTKGSLASVTEGVTMLADAYTNATNRMNMRAKTEGVLNTPDEKSSMQTSDKNTNPVITLSETQIEYTKALVSNVDDIRNILLGKHTKNFQNMLDFVNKNNMLQGDYARWGEMFRAAGILNEWNSLSDKEKEVIRSQANTRAGGDISFQGGKALINELGTEAVITPGGTLTALPSKTGIVPADITRNVWALGEVAPTLVAQLGSLTQKTLSGNAGNTTYEEGQYFDNFTMNVYPAKGDDFNKILEQARAQMRLTRHNN